MFDLTVFDAVECDDRDASARCERFMQRGEPFPQCADLVIHGDAQCMERLCRGMYPALPVPARRRARYDIREFNRALYGLSGTPLYDGLCDAAGKMFPAPAIEDVSDVRFIPRIHDLSCGERIRRRFRVERHEKRFILVEREPATPELFNAPPEVECDAVDLLNAVIGEPLPEPAKIRMHQYDVWRGVRESLLRICYRLRIGIEPDECAFGSQPFYQSSCVAAGTHRHIDVCARRLDAKPIYYFV